MKKYLPTIGLEIHAELKTATKMFCRSKNDPDELKPNVNVCPICMAHPGTLPVINRTAVLHVLRVGAAIGSTLADYTEFDRKSYFYPDLPKGYQISQYEFPLVSGGLLAGVAITRVHLEEDTASSVHSEESGETFIDFNRAGVPLMELVTEPVIKSAEEAGRFARELQLLLRYLGVSDADMEKGLMRVEANISVMREDGSGLNGVEDAVDRTPDETSSHGVLGTKVEVKNLNSFRAMERAVEYEIRRQSKLLEKGEKVSQETRGWDESKQATFAQRSKEGSADYRYFPDPDLPHLVLSKIDGASLEDILRGLPELPDARRQRYLRLGVKQEDAVAFVRDVRLGTFFEQVIAAFEDDARRIALAANYIANDMIRLLRDVESRDAETKAIPISSSHFQMLVNMIATGKVSSRGAKDILLEMLRADGDPQKIAADRGLFLAKSADIDTVIEDVLLSNTEVVVQYKAGKIQALEFLVGKTMKAMRGAGNPSEIREKIKKQLDG